MRNPLVAFQFSENRGYMGVLQHGLKKRHVESLSCYTPRFSWRDTVLWEYNLASGLGDRPLVVVDAWDTIILGSKAEMAGLIPQNEILFAGDIACWPDSRESDYAKSDSPWRFLNPQPHAGPANLIAAAIEECWHRWPIIGDDNSMEAENGTSMRFWTHMHLDSDAPTRIDTKCELGLTLQRAKPGSFSIAGGQVVNNITGSTPVFIHANGGSVIPPELLT